MMFVTDLTAFAQNGFYDIIAAIYPCICEVVFEVEIAHDVTFIVKCDECGVQAEVNSRHLLPPREGGVFPLLKPVLYIIPLLEAD